MRDPKRKKTILIVDDFPSYRGILRELIASRDYELIEAGDGAEALRLALEARPDLILLDVMMPGMDGLEVCRRLRAEPRLAEVPILVVTAVDDRETRLASIEAGADEFITKPFDREELRARVRAIVRLDRFRRLQEKAERLAQSEERLRSLIDNSPDAIVTIDDGCVIRDWSAEATRVFGFSADEAVGRSLPELILPAGQPEGRVDGKTQCRANILAPSGGRFEITARRRDGEEFPAEVSVARVPGGDGFQFMAILRDLTERKKAEASLQRSLREQEALLKEVHHRVKNNLQVILSLLRLESGRSQDGPARLALEGMQGRVLSMAMLHERLYRSGLFADVDLGDYLGRLAETAFRAHAMTGGSVRLTLDLISPRVGLDQALPCGLIVTELISNCLRHAFPDGRGGEVRVELRPMEGGRRLSLGVRDTGCGLPPNFDYRTGHSLGLRLVSDLARQLGGRLDAGPGPESGSSFAVTLEADPPDRTPARTEAAAKRNSPARPLGERGGASDAIEGKELTAIEDPAGEEAQ